MIRHIFTAFERSFRFIALIWWIYIIDFLICAVFGVQYSLNYFGLAPRTAQGLFGIVTMPFLHGNFLHIIENSMSLFVVLVPLYLELSDRFRMPEVIIKITVVSGSLLWFMGRGDSIHIGASALVYGLIVYACIAGFKYKRLSLLAFGAAAIFFSGGGLLMGIIPSDPQVSWDGHLMGAIAGAIVIFSERNLNDDRCSTRYPEPN